MNILEKLQERYIQEFADNIPFDEFLLNILVTALLVAVLRWFYIRYGYSEAGRRRFANNFLPLALGTLLIIMIVKSSIALSLGLVGALSIVRYRAAIKDPEELTYLFIAIGIGLAGGANQPVLAIVAFAFIIGLLYLGKRLSGRQSNAKEGRLLVHIHTDKESLEEIAGLLTSILPYAELRRMDTLRPGLKLSFVCRADNLEQLSRLKDAVSNLSPQTQLSIVEQVDLTI
ncbi:MAG TPA: DUF4956 domain-containing protein [Flavilitoribacter sp.]|nr:DUF4956 domain-containing protein [Lewinella sp.]MCB9281359.1 DUF4956 domain-containing protein [Lewinellaceae bacterium]HMQ61980.1 DUF4956 domain-containing protein [Flavilitoribacter sp.]HMQ90465.1 DUF4956 domain-containing protein [Flavilitoribacter sp.]